MALVPGANGFAGVIGTFGGAAALADGEALVLVPDSDVQSIPAPDARALVHDWRQRTARAPQPLGDRRVE